MTISSQLLEILVCPVTKLPVSVLSGDKLLKLNALIEQGDIVTKDQTAVTEKLEEALITNNEQTIYRVQEGIPIMLEDQGIDTAQISDW